MSELEKKHTAAGITAVSNKIIKHPVAVFSGHHDQDPNDKNEVCSYRSPFYEEYHTPVLPIEYYFVGKATLKITRPFAQSTAIFASLASAMALAMARPSP